MQFLLLLSALLSAVTGGAFGTARIAEPQAGQAEARLVADVPAERQVLAVAVRLIEPDRGGVAAGADAPPLLDAAPAKPTPLDLVRLNE
jgi:hypothetical protein